MLGHNILVWNVRGLNMRARRAVVREFLLQERVSLLCLVETKINVLSASMAAELMGTMFDYVCLPASGASWGIILGWCRDTWCFYRAGRRPGCAVAAYGCLWPSRSPPAGCLHE